MLADPAAQRRLLDVAALDVKLVHLRHRAANLPENEELKGLQAERVALAGRITEAATRRGDAQAEFDRVDRDLEAARARQERNRGRADSGEIADQRALQSLLAEIGHLDGRISDLEDIELEAMQEIEDATGVHDELLARRAGIEDRMRALLASRDRSKAEITEQGGRLMSERELAREPLPAELLALYDKIAGRTGSSGAAELRARRCGGCGMELDQAELHTIAASRPDAVARCEECGRILVRTGESGL
ncbi:C4-type zinc ribbon domain-containing protein [uncultured Propionibacterium sp.]|uniref:zinc ribbon domain-containing protein n=1 Tax=uncultured Propionibacterium sp. TaxID=218066 RepID=UPI00292CE9BA|nr:C4-type zinc ribbon domain-containing protein [uncultured Propionibacterium sp.]